MSQLQKKFQKEISAQLGKELGLKNIMAVPKISKVVLNIGLSRAVSDKQWIDIAKSILVRITGQQPLETKAKKSISNFKIRQGMVIGAKVTLRGARMYDFLERLINATLPRLRDFYGLDTRQGFDGQGSYTMGFKEHIIFPEIGLDDVDKVHGLQVTIATTAKDPKSTLALLRAVGFPFKKDKKK